MEKRSIFLIIFSVIGLVAISIIESIGITELIEWLILMVYAIVILITLYIPMKKEDIKGNKDEVKKNSNKKVSSSKKKELNKSKSKKK